MRHDYLLIILSVLSLIPAAVALPPIHHDNAPFNETASTDGFSVQSSGMIPVIIQTTDSTKPEDLIEDSGGSLHGYLPEQAWYAVIPTYGKTSLKQNQHISRIIELEAKDKIDTRLKTTDATTVKARVTLFDSSADLKSDIKKIANLTYLSGEKTIITVEGTITGIRQLAKHQTIKAIFPVTTSYQKHNNKARSVIDAEGLQEPPRALTGDGITGAIWDAGWVGDHEDINATSKLSIGDYNCDSCDVDYHATHVAGTMAGNGTLNNDLRGIAPDADIASFEWPQNESVEKKRQELKNETQDAVQDYNAVVGQNSWGYLINEDNKYLMGEYIGLSPTYDTLIHGGSISSLDKGIPIVFSVGNEGRRNQRYNTTTGPGATAKNTITVGAVADTKTLTSYSSWGPTDDNRIKPDLMANGGSISVGTGIRSAIPSSSNLYSYPYQAFTGTSMAAPAVSGLIIQLSQFYNETYNHIPSPALWKALLIHTADDINTTGPDYHTGWGIVNSSKAVSYLENDQSTSLIHEDTLETPSDNDTYTISIDPNASSINFTLAWSDYPAEEKATKTLVNDIDLFITNSTGHRFYPWTLDGYSNPDAPAQQDRKDQTNPVEQVTIWNPEDIVYTINVTSTTETIPEAPQNYSLILSDQTIDTLVPTLRVFAPANNSIISGKTDLKAYPSDNQAINTTEVTIANESDTQWTGTFNTTVDTTAFTDGEYSIRFEATDMNGNTNISTHHVTINNKGPQLTPIYPESNAYLNQSFWINATWGKSVVNTTYTVFNETKTVKEGQLNETIDINTIVDGAYTINYTVKDKTGFTTSTERIITIDKTKPTITPNTPTDGQAVGETFLINNTASDAKSPVSIFQYQIKNTTSNQTAWQSLKNPDTVDSTQYKDGTYNVTIQAIDKAGNKATKTIENIIIDNTAPVVTTRFNLTLDNRTAAINGPYGWTLNTTHIGLSWNDTLAGALTDTGSGINQARIQERNRSFRINGTISEWGNWTNATTIDPATSASNRSTLIGNDSTSYQYQITLWDKAGNKNTSNTVITGIDNSGPNIKLIQGQKAVAPFNWTNSSVITPSVNVTDFSGIRQPTNMTLNITLWEQNRHIDRNVTTTDTDSGIVEAIANTSIKDLNETKIYNLTIAGEDRYGHSQEQNWTVQTDFTPPNLSLTSYPANTTANGWYRTPVIIEQTCSDTAAGFYRQSINQTDQTIQTWENTTPTNSSITKNGNNSHTAICEDYAGNSNSTSTYLPIDTTPPTITGTSPMNTSDDQDTSLSVTISFTDQSSASGIYQSSSTIVMNGGDGSITGQSWTNDSVTVDLSSLEHATTYTITGTLNDTAGNTEPFHLAYTTEDAPDPDTGSDPAPSRDFVTTTKTPAKDQSTVFWSQIEDNTPADTELGDNHSSGVRKISIETNETRDNAAINISGQRDRPDTVPTPNRSTYQYLSIEAQNLPEYLIKNASISFSVNRSWIRENNINRTTLRLTRYQDQWQPLSTAFINQTDQTYEFRATTPGFSYFVIGAETADSPTQTTTTNDPMYCGNGRCDQNETWQTCGIDCDPPQIVTDARDAIQQANQTIPPDAPEQQIIARAVEQYNQYNFEQALQIAEAATEAYQTEKPPVKVRLFLLIIGASLIGTFLAILYHHFSQKLPKD